MKRKIIKTSIWLVVCVITGWISAKMIAEPVFLTEEEIEYYAETADKVWNQGLHAIEEDDSIIIRYELEKNEVHVSSTYTNKQSVTVNFDESESLVTVNEPVVSFWGCFGFYGVFIGSIIYGILNLVAKGLGNRKQS